MLFNDWGDFNKCIIEPRQNSDYIEREIIEGKWEHNISPTQTVYYNRAYKVTEIRFGKIEWVGMDYATAVRCAREELEKTEWLEYYSEWNPITGVFDTKAGGIRTYGKANIINTGGKMYSVVIDYTSKSSTYEIIK